MNLSQLESLVWSWLDDPQGQYFTQAQVDVWLNNAQQETQKRLIAAGENFYVTKMQGLTIANQNLYALPADFRKCHKFEIVVTGTGVNENRVTLADVTYQQLEQVSQTTGLPSSYNIRRNLVDIRPIPDNAYTIYLHQSYRVADMVNSTDVPDIPREYHEYLAVLASIDGFTKDQRDPSAFVMTKKKDYESRMDDDSENRDVSAPRSVICTDTTAGIPW